MPPYEKMYFHLFNAITDALEMLDRQDYAQARMILITAQRWGESNYTDADNNPE